MTPLKDFSHKTLLAIKEPGEYRDGFSDVKGLILRVRITKDGSVNRQWIWRYTLPHTGGKRETISPGVFPAIGVAEARGKVREYSKYLREGTNPKTQRDQERAEIAKNVQRQTFRHVAKDYWNTHHKTWKNEKVRAQWIDSWMENYTFPHIGSLDVADIRLNDVVTVLKPIWTEKNPTARKINQAIGNVLEYAVAKGWRDEDLVNPSKQKERLIHLLARVKRVKNHQPSLHYEEGPKFYADLKQHLLRTDSTGGYLSLEFLVLTGLRTDNLLTLEWDDIDHKKKLVNVPARKMKGGTKDFSYPLIDRCIEILKLRKKITGGTGFVFTGRKDKQMSSGAMLEAIKVICAVKDIKRTDPKYKPKYTDRQSGRRIVPHGFRSTIFSWAEDHGYKLEDCEAIIAHTKGDQNLAAYARGNKLEIRRQIMEAYYTHLCPARSCNLNGSPNAHSSANAEIQESDHLGQQCG